jgi:type VI secretion system secreted protein VgrG
MASDNNLRLAFAVDSSKFPGLDDQDLFDVRQFSVSEQMSGLFEVNVVAVVEEPDIPLAAFVGRAAALRIQTPNPNAASPVRVWAGVCAHMSHLHAAEEGVSAYHFNIVPILWRTTLRKNSRIYQHLSTPDIVTALLAEWKIVAKWNLAATYGAHEYCVQYGETDYDFMCRLLEDAGISFYFNFNAPSGKGNDIVTLVFDDAPATATGANTRKGALTYAGNQTPAFGSLPDFCTTVSVTQAVRPGKVHFRDFDFRLPPTLNLAAIAQMGGDVAENVYEQYEYSPGEFLWEPGKADEPAKTQADKYSKGKLPRSVDDAGKKTIVANALEAERRRQLLVGFHTNAIDVRPGMILGINQQAAGTSNHPRSDLTPDQKLVIIGTHLEGENSGEWTMTATAVYANFPLRPERRTPKPRIFGVQSAIVVGPANHEIWTDEFGRVRVQFHWDREGKYDDNSSCWLRVSQAWAGGGFGVIAVPRVGHEVLVQFFEGDPDQPIIVGRVHNLSAPVPYPLPGSQTITAIKSNSTPGGGGFNEIRLDDTAGGEEIHVQAQNSLSTVVKGGETRSVGSSRTTKVGDGEELHIGASRTTLIKESDLTAVQTNHSVFVGTNHTGHIYTDKNILFSSGGASIELSDGNIYITATNGIHMHAGTGIEVTTYDQAITIQGGPDVVINQVTKGPHPNPKQVGLAAEPGKPDGGPSGTPPTLPTGGGTIDQPGPLSADVDVETPDNAVELA